MILTSKSVCLLKSERKHNGYDYLVRLIFPGNRNSLHARRLANSSFAVSVEEVSTNSFRSSARADHVTSLKVIVKLKRTKDVNRFVI